MKIPKKRGFASMGLEQRQEIASMGGKPVPPEKRPVVRHVGAQLRPAALAGLPGLSASDGCLVYRPYALA
jgi:hypothetical protein